MLRRLRIRGKVAEDRQRMRDSLDPRYGCLDVADRFFRVFPMVAIGEAVGIASLGVECARNQEARSLRCTGVTSRLLPQGEEKVHERSIAACCGGRTSLAHVSDHRGI